MLSYSTMAWVSIFDVMLGGHSFWMPAYHSFNTVGRPLNILTLPDLG